MGSVRKAGLLQGDEQQRDEHQLRHDARHGGKQRTKRINGGVLYKELKKNGILVRHFDAPRIENWLRITIGTPEQMQALMDSLHNIFLVSDEPYRDIVFDGKTVPYPAAFYPHTLTCFSYSKSLSLPGERLGYVAVRPGCEGEDILVDMMSQISRFTGHNCPPSIIQRAVGRCQEVTSDLSVYETNMNLLYDKLTALGFEVERPGGTFYIFPKALEEDVNAFCMKAREFDLLLVPSDSFGVKGYVRLAYCIDTEKVKRSLPALEKLAAAYRK